MNRVVMKPNLREIQLSKESRKVLKKVRKMKIESGDFIVLPQKFRREGLSIREAFNRLLPKDVVIIFADNIKRIPANQIYRIPQINTIIEEVMLQCINEVLKERQAVERSTKIKGKFYRVLSLQDVRDRLFKMKERLCKKK